MRKGQSAKSQEFLFTGGMRKGQSAKSQEFLFTGGMRKGQSAKSQEFLFTGGMRKAQRAKSQELLFTVSSPFALRSSRFALCPLPFALCSVRPSGRHRQVRLINITEHQLITGRKFTFRPEIVTEKVVRLRRPE